MRDLGTLGGSNGAGHAINASGQVAGGSQVSGNSAAHAFRYDGTPGAGGMMRDLGTLGGTNSQALAINNSGQVAGYSETVVGEAAYHAMRYDGTPGAGGTLHDLGTLGGSYSTAYTLNFAGQIVGWSLLPGDSMRHPFFYTGTPGAGGQMTDLDTWLDANNPVEGAKWNLRFGYGLSDTGWVVGEGIFNDGPGGMSDGTRAFLLDASALVPEPCTLMLCAAGLMAGRRSRRACPERSAAERVAASIQPGPSRAQVLPLDIIYDQS